MRSRWALACAALLCALSVPAAAAADCHVRSGQHVVLYSSMDDPDVLLWDSRFRLRDYWAASFDTARQLERHALLVPPGIRAIVESCVPDFVISPLFTHPDDAIGVVVVTGQDRGHNGWVLGSDVRIIRHATSTTEGTGKHP